jgi:hypothetical protein
MASINFPLETAQQIDREKLRLEAQTARELRTVFNNIGNDAEAIYSLSGQLDARELANNYRSEFLVIIRQAYRRTIKKFGFDLRKSIEKKYDINFDVENKISFIDINYKQEVQVTDESLDANIDSINQEYQQDATLFVANQSEQQADIITNTNENEIEKAVAVGTAAYLATSNSLEEERRDIIDEIFISQDAREVSSLQRRLDRVSNEIERVSNERQAIIGKNIGDKIKQDGVARSELIATQEVGVAESFSREREALLINNAGLVRPSGETLIVFKEWVSILDSRTRQAHVISDGQRVPINQPFIVDGESLVYPRDTNGSPGNIINCRCVAIYLVI